MCEKCERSALLAGVRVSLLGDKPRLEIFAPTGSKEPVASIELDSTNVALELASAICSVSYRLLGDDAFKARFAELGSQEVDFSERPSGPLN